MGFKVAFARQNGHGYFARTLYFWVFNVGVRAKTQRSAKPTKKTGSSEMSIRPIAKGKLIAYINTVAQMPISQMIPLYRNTDSFYPQKEPFTITCQKEMKVDELSLV